jgi:formylglycine-generating enzyme required for sulfatase activity
MSEVPSFNATVTDFYMDTFDVSNQQYAEFVEANAANLRVRYRDSHRPHDAREMVGFRCARSAP